MKYHITKDGNHFNTIVADAAFVAEVYPSPTYVATPLIGNADISAERDRRVLGGNTFQVTNYGPVRLTGDQTTTTNLQGQAVAAQARMATGDVTTLRPWKDADNIIHQLTPPQMFELWSLKSDYVSDVFEASWALKVLDPIPSDYGEDIHWPAKPVQ